MLGSGIIYHDYWLDLDLEMLGVASFIMIIGWTWICGMLRVVSCHAYSLD